MPRREASIAPLRAQRVLAVFGLRLAPALTAGAIVASHTGRVGDGLLAAAAVLIVVRAVDRGRRYAQLMPAAGMVGAVLAPLAGIGLAWLVSLAFEPLPGHAVFPAMLGTLLVTALGAWLVTRFEQVAEIRIAVVGSAEHGPRPRGRARPHRGGLPGGRLGRPRTAACPPTASAASAPLERSG